MTDDAWANFIASIDPVALEHERMRVHGNLEHERPGSRQDHEMRAAHEWLKQDRATPKPATPEAHQQQVDDVDRFVLLHGGTILQPRRPGPAVSDEELDQRFAAYRAARKAAA